ncbi:C39 family peptidase [Spiroplasma platyhelix]|uniref:Peptidase C39-like domain-containing protein n=1 Tax=Spiroplasma platyhelix PALS-1 TaxID=1276218 RepID=A0A846U536_9MOLU|nr:C39 family peptidase [Spiroplasma platyhelix]MBE4704194.1 hypothetical protein [Spiroplasma platyhelix PALS-1]NKE38567.1 hypothetical protein [Spiroplasma platyhelix PALS-1]UJB28778.1 hypothetical protein SPLAT_v1c00110 [Spiroplasma platyhelix PALS-1]
MKQILTMLGALTLGLVTSSSIIANVTPLTDAQKEVNLYENIYNKNLENFPIFLQVGNNYCVPATLQGVLQYLTDNSPSQQEIAARVGTTPSGTFAHNVREFFESFLWGNRQVYYPHVLPPYYGATMNHMLMFQSAIIQSLDQGLPVVLGFVGYVPWTGLTPTQGHAVAITGIQVDDNPEATVYTVAETETGQFSTFTGQDLRAMIIHESFLFLPNQNVYNFVDETMNLWVNGAQGNLIDWAQPDPQIIYESANLFGSLGILSLDILHNATSIDFPEFWLNYDWKKMHDYAPKFNLDPTKITADSGWIKDNAKSVHWTDDANDEAIVNVEFNQTLSKQNNDLTLTFRYKITGNGDRNNPDKSPSINFNMGNYWKFSFK